MVKWGSHVWKDFENSSLYTHSFAKKFLDADHFIFMINEYLIFLPFQHIRKLFCWSINMGASLQISYSSFYSWGTARIRAACEHIVFVHPLFFMCWRCSSENSLTKICVSNEISWSSCRNFRRHENVKCAQTTAVNVSTTSMIKWRVENCMLLFSS
jgi:hypothetical protein